MTRQRSTDIPLDASLTWSDIKFLKSITKLPIWLKGIMTEEDALLAIEQGADAIYVSNHGGRQLDSSPPTLRVLEDICKVVNKRIPVVSTRTRTYIYLYIYPQEGSLKTPKMADWLTQSGVAL